MCSPPPPRMLRYNKRESKKWPGKNKHSERPVELSMLDYMELMSTGDYESWLERKAEEESNVGWE